MEKISEQQMKELVEIGLDEPLSDFDVNENLFDTYGLESMGVVAMVVEIQRRMKIKIPDEIIPKLFTGRDYISFINNRIESSNILINASHKKMAP